MTPLQAQLHRLYLSHEPTRPSPDGADSSLIAPDGTVRAMVLELARPADWTLMSKVWRGVQADLELPAPAIAVTGIDAFQLWFSLAESVTVAKANVFLESLSLRYWSQVAPERLSIRPWAEASNPGNHHHAMLVPALQPATGRWSAFVAPDLAAIFSEEPWLDLPPNPEAQASVLSRLESIKPAGFEAAMERLRPVSRTQTSTMPPLADRGTGSKAKAEVKVGASTDNNPDPKGFLLGVMRDETIALQLRIEAAKALLPYCEGQGGNGAG